MTSRLRVLIACERSQVEQQAFAARGHWAYSLDILPCYGPDPAHHIVADAYEFPLGGWDLIIAHPPCTELSHVNNARRSLPGRVDPILRALRLWARFLFEAPCPVAVENPVGIPSEILPATQIVSPELFGEPYRKRICLWLRGVPPLTCTVIHTRPASWVGGRKKDGVACQALGFRRKDRAIARSQSFAGIAAAMADQWGGYLLTQRRKSSTGSPDADLRRVKDS